MPNKETIGVEFLNFFSFGENNLIMVNWQFYGEDDKSSTPPQLQKTKINGSLD